MIVKIDKYDDLGNGIAKINNKVCFIKNGMENETVDIQITKEKKNYSEARILNIIESNKFRIEPICKYYFNCGGCNFLHMKSEEEKKIKIERCINYFSKNDGFFATKKYNYRNKINLHVKNGKVGFYKEKSNNLIPINYCYLVDNKINSIINFFNEYSDFNFNGSILIRVNTKSETMVVINGKYCYIDKLMSCELINNLVYNNQVKKGRDYFIEFVKSYRFIVHYQSFFQVNIVGLEKILDLLTEFIKDKKIDTVLDLYSGTSVLGIHVSKYVNNVTSIEINSFATYDAIKNIKLNNVNNLKVINGSVSDYIDNFNNVDLIILDPVRKGIDLKTVEYLKKISPPYIIYISCEITSLTRDLEYLKDSYELQKICMVDMFPNTIHVECVALLSFKILEK